MVDSRNWADCRPRCPALRTEDRHDCRCAPHSIQSSVGIAHAKSLQFPRSLAAEIWSRIGPTPGLYEGSPHEPADTGPRLSSRHRARLSSAELFWRGPAPLFGLSHTFDDDGAQVREVPSPPFRQAASVPPAVTNPARPYICRLIVFNWFTCISTGPSVKVSARRLQD
jgi:hypothetical protein